MVEIGSNVISSLEPGRKFLGTLTMPDFTEANVLVNRFSLSRVDNRPIEVRRHAEPAFFPGQVEPGEITLGVYVFTEKLKQILQTFYGKTYTPQRGTLGMASNIKKDVSLQILGPDGSPRQTITLQRAWITGVNAGDINWNDNAIIEAELTLRFEKVEFS